MGSSLKQTGNSDLVTGLILLTTLVVMVVFFGFLCYNTRLESEYDSEHTYVKCWNTGAYVCTQNWFGGCARYEPQTKCQRYRKQDSPTFDEWKPARDR